MRTEPRTQEPLDEPDTGILSLLRTGGLGVLLGGNHLSALGTWIHITVAAWVMFELTGSSAMVGALNVAQYAPIVMFTLPAGMVVDHRDRRRALISIQTTMMTLALLLAALVWGGYVTPVVLVVVTVGMGIGKAFAAPTWVSFIGDIVPPHRAMLGFSLNSVTFHLAATLGPVVGAFLFASVGAGGSFAVNGISYLAVITALFAIRARPPTPGAFPGLRRSVGEMYRFARVSQRARRLLPVSAAVAVVAFGLRAVLPAYASGVLGGEAASYGSLAGGIGAGSLAGAIMLGIMQSRTARRTIILTGAWLVAVGAAGLAVGGSTTVAIASLVGVGAGQLMLLVTARTVIQLDAPQWLRARAVGLWFMSSVGIGPLAGVVLGWATDAWGIRLTVVATAVYSVLAAVGMVVASRSKAGIVSSYSDLVGTPVEEPALSDRSR